MSSKFTTVTIRREKLLRLRKKLRQLEVQIDNLDLETAYHSLSGCMKRINDLLAIKPNAKSNKL